MYFCDQSSQTSGVFEDDQVVLGTFFYSSVTKLPFGKKVHPKASGNNNSKKNSIDNSGSRTKKHCIRSKRDKVRMVVGKDVKVEEISGILGRVVVGHFSGKMVCS
jgi:hypothetical protein